MPVERCVVAVLEGGAAAAFRRPYIQINIQIMVAESDADLSGSGAGGSDSAQAQSQVTMIEPTAAAAVDSNPNRVRLPYNFKRIAGGFKSRKAPQRLVDVGLTQDEWATFHSRLGQIHETPRCKIPWGKIPCGFLHNLFGGCDFCCAKSRTKKRMGEWADGFNEVLQKYEIFLKLQTTSTYVEKRFEGELPQDYYVRVDALVFAVGNTEIDKLKAEPDTIHKVRRQI